MSASLRFGRKKKIVRRNIAKDASPPPLDRVEATAPTLEQVEDIIAAARATDSMLATIITVTALTGVRRGELCGLRWSDVNGDVLTIARSVYEVGDGSMGVKQPKTRQTRRIGLDPVTMYALQHYRASVEALADDLDLDLPPDAYIFSISPQGTEPLRPGLVTERYARVAKAVGASTVRFHALRHFHATRAIAEGHDIVTVSKRLGHSDPSMTLRVYAHVVEQRDRELAAAMGAELALRDGVRRGADHRLT
jgi:integrase